MILAILAYWGLALPLGMLLGITDEIVPAMGEEGFWIGIVTGLTTAAIAMLIRLTLVIKKYNQTVETNTASQPELAIQ